MAKIDIKMAKNSNGIYDMAISGGDLQYDQSFDTNIQLSLFTDRRASESEVQQPNKRRGWFGDVFTTLDGYQIGSKLWLISQERLTTSTLNKAKAYAQTALQWIVDKGYATRIDIAAIPDNNENIYLTIKILVNNDIVASFTYRIWRNSQYAS